MLTYTPRVGLEEETAVYPRPVSRVVLRSCPSSRNGRRAKYCRKSNREHLLLGYKLGLTLLEIQIIFLDIANDFFVTNLLTYKSPLICESESHQKL